MWEYFRLKVHSYNWSTAKLPHKYSNYWLGGVAVGRRIRDREVGLDWAGFNVSTNTV